MEFNLKELFVSTDGNDGNSGTISSPLATVKKAIEILRCNNAENATIYVRKGRYFIDDTIEFGEKDKGLTVSSFNNEEVFFDGGIVIKNEDIKDYKDGIKVVDLKPYNIKLGEYGVRGFRRTYVNAPNELFIDGEPYHVSRYPKNENIYLTDEMIADRGSRPSTDHDFSCRKPIIKYSSEKAKTWQNEKDMYIAGYPAAAWADDCLKVVDIDTEKGEFTLKFPHFIGYAANGHSNIYFLNLFSELSEKGEYYVDTEEQKLYFIPVKNTENSLIQLSVLDKVMFAFENAENVTLRGITIENSRNSGAYFEGGEGCKIENCVFRNLGILAVQFGQGASPQPDGLHTHHGERAEGVPVPVPISREMGSWHEYLYEFAAWDNNAGKNHIISGCHIYNMGAGGIMLSGGNRKNLIPGNNTVYNCEIHHVNRLDKTYKAGINIMGMGNNIQHCEIYDMPSFAIYVHGNDHIIEYNKIHDAVTENSDSAAIYMGRDMSEVGTVFRYNYIYNIQNNIKGGLGVAALYFDDGAIYNTVYGNYFYGIKSGGTVWFSTIFHNNGGLSTIANNFFIDCEPGLSPMQRSNSFHQMHNDKLANTRVHTVDPEDMHGVDVTSDIWKKKYPYLYKTYEFDYNPGNRYWHNLTLYKQYDFFVDGEHQDFTFKDDAGVFNWNGPQYRITDDVFGLNNEMYPLKRVDFKSIGLVSKK